MMNKIYYYWLSTIEGVGIKKINNIREHFGSVKEAWEAGKDDFLSIDGFNPQTVKNIMLRRDENKLLSEIRGIESKGINILTMEDECYPEKLKNIYDPPVMLYSKGKFKKCRKYIGIVGSRICTPCGRTVARTIARQLAAYDIGIISGMARGIDTQAHLGAIEGGGFTCAVLGCGCDVVYPPENTALMAELEKIGSVLSEYPPGTQPEAYNFPQRNRIISGISDGVLVVEAGEKSGALITVNFALEQGRDVFAVPGSILSNCSRGSNALIRDGARPVMGLEDILNEWGIDIEDKKTVNMEFTPDEQLIADKIGDLPVFVDALISSVSMKASRVNSILTSLELKGAVKLLPGKYIVRIF